MNKMTIEEEQKLSKKRKAIFMLYLVIIAVTILAYIFDKNYLFAILIVSVIGITVLAMIEYK